MSVTTTRVKTTQKLTDLRPDVQLRCSISIASGHTRIKFKFVVGDGFVFIRKFTNMDGHCLSSGATAINIARLIDLKFISRLSVQ